LAGIRPHPTAACTQVAEQSRPALNGGRTLRRRGLYGWGERLFGGPAWTGLPEPPAPELVAELVVVAGLPDEFAAAADDKSWDAALPDSLDAASKSCGPHPFSPAIVLEESLTGMSGPVFSPVPAGEAALRAWDAVGVLLAEPGFFELRRARTGPPAFAAG
jgi:hypothetical protein